MLLPALTDIGFSAFYENQDVSRKDDVPEMTGLNQKEVDALPPYLKYFKCDGGVEKGDCDKGHKYTVTEVCPKRIGMVSWHPG